MRKLLGRLLVLGALAGGIVALRGYLRGRSPGEETVQITFDDGSMSTLTSDTAEAQELTDIARKVVGVGI